MEEQRKRITIAYGDGIGPEIMTATLRVLEAAQAPLDYDVVEVGERIFRQGHTSGITREAWDLIQKNQVMLKAPITTPQGGGYKSINVTIRKALGLFANVRHCKSYTPYVSSPYPGMDLVIIRENEEDLYAGIEHQQTREVTQVLKLITWPGSESIIRYAFEYARAYGRKRVTCMTKDNIMKITDGLFHCLFDEVAAEYPDIKANHQIIDIGAARVAAQPDSLDVVVTPNLYGDIISDIAAQVAGSVGLAGSANIGRGHAMFEAIHGSAPDIAGKDVANPSGLLQAAIQMLVHLGLPETAQLINNAWLSTLEAGIHTIDIYRQGFSTSLVSTQAFADGIIRHLGQVPENLTPVSYQGQGIQFNVRQAPVFKKELVGVDVFVDWSESGRSPEVIGRKLEQISGNGLKLKMVTNRGIQVYPQDLPGIFCTDHWRCRFVAEVNLVNFTQILDLLHRMYAAGFEVIKTEHLYNFDGAPGYSLGQGE